MGKCTLFLAALFFAAQQLSAQCPVTLNCPSASLQICDETNNSPDFWNNTYWWDAQVVNHNLSDAAVDLTVTATDDCSNGIFTFQYLLFLDLDGDGSQETVINSDNLPPNGTVHFNNVNSPNYSGGIPQVFDQRNIPAVFKYRFSMQTLVKGGQLGIARLRWQDKGFDNYKLPQLPYGTHRIKWTVTNSVGNQADCEYAFTIKDCKAPDVVCFNGLSVNIMPSGAIKIWDIDFLEYANDNYLPAGQLQFALSTADASSFPVDAGGLPQTSVTFYCDDLGPAPLKLWARDLAGNTSFCETTLDIRDDNVECGDNPPFSICAETVCTGEGIEDINFIASGTPPPGLPPITVFDMSDDQGCAGISMIPPEYVNSYSISSSKDDNPMNGISSYDLLLISWHIDGTQPFTEPWQWIAADADNNGIIDSADIIQLSNLNLGIYTELPDNSSWRFYPSNYVFPPGNPLAQPIPNSLSIADIIADPTLKFIGVKIGDVNCSNIPNAFSQNPTERSSPLSKNPIISTPQPNPTTAGTSIPIQLAQQENVVVNISDLSGKLLWFNELSLENGSQLLEIPSSAFPVTGIYLWRVQAGEVVQSGKIVRQ